jgi:hypothetical protein
VQGVADLLEHVNDLALRDERMRASLRDVMADLARHLQRPAQALKAGAMQSLEALLREHGWQGAAL